jgi:hypothetical protein
MKFLTRLFTGKNREINLTTALERQRLGCTMPGQTGAMAGARFGTLGETRFPSAGSSASSKTLACISTAAWARWPRGGFLLRRPACWPLCDPCRKFSLRMGVTPIDN